MPDPDRKDPTMGRYPHEATFTVMGLDCLAITTEPEELFPAIDEVIATVNALAATTSLDLHGSEVSRLGRLARFAEITVPASDALIDYLRAALWAADLTGGLVDPTVGSLASEDQPYGWERIVLGEGTVTLPRGCVLDLSATAPARAADLLVQRLAEEHRGGFLVSIGGDMAVAGDHPDEGWRIPVTSPTGKTLQLVSTTRAALARSAAAATEGATAVVDPRTGDVADGVWTQVTVAAGSALEANAWATASVVLGERAPDWLTHFGVPARLERRTGTTRFTQGWPHPRLVAA